MELFCSQFKAMGSPCEVSLYAPTYARAQQATAVVVAEIRRLENKYSRYLENSVLSLLNQRAASEPVTVDEETARLLDYANQAYQQSNGLFDITSGILRQAWDFKKNRLPDKASVETLLSRVGWSKVSWVSPVIRFNVAGMEIDLGGVVKEYAVDAATRTCYDQGVYHGLIDLGGDLRIVGPHPSGEPWLVGIRDPHHPEKRKALTHVAVYKGGVASSGCYERFIEINGTRYGHLLLPSTGWPPNECLSSATVLAQHAVVAGTASTVALLQEAQAALLWLDQLGLPYVCVDQQGHVHKKIPES